MADADALLSALRMLSPPSCSIVYMECFDIFGKERGRQSSRLEKFSLNSVSVIPEWAWEKTKKRQMKTKLGFVNPRRAK
jgi:hypothetical protein